MTGLIQRSFLVAGGFLVALVAAEFGVRVARPDLQYAAESASVFHRSRIFANPRNQSFMRRRPDTGEKHWVIWNSLGSRQHREFAREKPPGTKRIGIFGDSFVENRRLPVQYSFTEPLDHLLNRSGEDFEVLNFGNDGYGTDQSYLLYADEGASLDLDVVLYAYYSNDLGDNVTNQLIDLNDAGRIVYRTRQPPALWVRWIRRFYLTYLALEAYGKLESADLRLGDPVTENVGGLPPALRLRRATHARLPLWHAHGVEHPAVDRAIDLLSALLEEMRRVAERSSASFYVALVPGAAFERYRAHHHKLRQRIESMGIRVIDLTKTFETSDRDARAFFFQRDSHWNEAGNRWAAIHLFKALAPALDVDASDAFVDRELARYYAAFPTSGGNPAWPTDESVDAETREQVRERYLALERQATPER